MQSRRCATTGDKNNENNRCAMSSFCRRTKGVQQYMHVCIVNEYTSTHCTVCEEVVVASVGAYVCVCVGKSRWPTSLFNPECTMASMLCIPIQLLWTKTESIELAQTQHGAMMMTTTTTVIANRKTETDVALRMCIASTYFPTYNIKKERTKERTCCSTAPSCCICKRDKAPAKRSGVLLW